MLPSVLRMCMCKVSHIGTRPESLLVWLPRITEWCWMFSLSPAQFVKAIKTPDKHLTIVISSFFFKHCKNVKTIYHYGDYSVLSPLTL